MSDLAASEPSRACPKCGAELPADGTNGLCPACLMAEVMVPSEPKSKPTGRWEPPTAAELAKLLPQYDIECLRGRGGMGAAYKGTQKSLERAVAIKILSTALDDSDRGFAERFKNEARAMAKLKHPGIVDVYDSGETGDGLLYIVMEFIEGTDVAKMISKNGRLHTDHAMAITAHVCDALAYAHERGIIHRDIKPANIMVGYDGVVKVADFGLAKVSNDHRSGLTQSGMAMGTLYYMAPEALMLGTAVDHRADIYAVGVMLYQMLTGKLPQGLFELPSLQIVGLDPRYDGIIGKALREDRDLRYPNAMEMRHDLDAILTQPVIKVEAAAEKPPAALPPQARPQRPAGQPYRPPQQKPQVAVRAEKKAGPLPWIAAAAACGVATWFALHQGTTDKVSTTPAPAVEMVAPMPPRAETDDKPKEPNTPVAASPAMSRTEPAAIKTAQPSPLPVVTGKAASAPEPAPAGAIVRVTDVLPLFNPNAEVIRGKWSTTRDGLYVKPGDAGPYTIAAKFVPAREFDYEIEFSSENEAVSTIIQLFEVNGRLLEWTMNAHPTWERPFFAFTSLDGVNFINRTEASVSLPPQFVKGKRYRAVVQVRKESISGLLDGKVMVQWKGDLSRFRPVTSFDIPPGRIAMSSWTGGATFHAAKVTEYVTATPELLALEQQYRSAIERQVTPVVAEYGRTLLTSYSNAVAKAISNPGNSPADTPFLKAEVQRLTTERNVPEMDPAGTPQSLASLRNIYRQALAKFRDEKTAPIKAIYDEQLSKSIIKEAPPVQGKPKIAYTNTLGMKFVAVPGTDVLMCIHETRNRDFKAYAAANPDINLYWSNTSLDDSAGLPITLNDNDPVRTTVNHGRPFCEWLSKMEGRTYRLPTDREWSYAVGIGEREDFSPGITPQMRHAKVDAIFPWGGTFPPTTASRAGNYGDATFLKAQALKAGIASYDDGNASLAPVMSHAPNALGIYDLGGNAAEWCDDFFDAEKKYTLLRGGNYMTSDRTLMLSSARVLGFLAGGTDRGGLRCVIESKSIQTAAKGFPTPVLEWKESHQGMQAGEQILFHFFKVTNADDFGDELFETMNGTQARPLSYTLIYNGDKSSMNNVPLYPRTSLSKIRLEVSVQRAAPKSVRVLIKNKLDQTSKESNEATIPAYPEIVARWYQNNDGLAVPTYEVELRANQSATFTGDGKELKGTWSLPAETLLIQWENGHSYELTPPNAQQPKGMDGKGTNEKGGTYRIHLEKIKADP